MWACLTGQWIEHSHRVACKIHEQLFARRMRLAHRRRHAPTPVAVEAAKPAVAKPIRLVGAVLQPEQHQRHATALELLVQARPIQWRTLRFLLERGGREQPPFQLGVVDLLRHRPGDADHLGPANVLPDRRLPDPERLRNRTVAHSERVPQPKHLANPPHRQSLSWHPASPAFVAGAGSRDSIADGQPALTPPQRWPPSIGILPAISWNQWPLYVGIRNQTQELPGSALRRGSYRPEEQDHPPVGEAQHPPERSS